MRVDDEQSDAGGFDASDRACVWIALRKRAIREHESIVRQGKELPNSRQRRADCLAL